MRLNASKSKIRKKRNIEKYNSFSDYVLNDEEQVLPLLINMSRWVGMVLMILLTILFVVYDNTFFVILFGILTLLSVHGLIKYYLLGGKKALPHLSAGQAVWGKDFTIKK